jgi:hypothetical protein
VFLRCSTSTRVFCLLPLIIAEADQGEDYVMTDTA